MSRDQSVPGCNLDYGGCTVVALRASSFRGVEIAAFDELGGDADAPGVGDGAGVAAEGAGGGQEGEGREDEELHLNDFDNFLCEISIYIKFKLSFSLLPC